MSFLEGIAPMITKNRHGREGSSLQSLILTFQKFMMKISLIFSSITQGEYENNHNT